MEKLENLSSFRWPNWETLFQYKLQSINFEQHARVGGYLTDSSDLLKGNLTFVNVKELKGVIEKFNHNIK